VALRKECPKCHRKWTSKADRCKHCGTSLKGPHIVWWVYLRFPDRTYVRRIGPDRKAAEAHELEVKREKIRNKLLKKTDPASVTVEDIWPRYYAWCLKMNRDPQTKLHRWEKHLRHFWGPRPLSEIDLKTAEEYRMKRLREGVRPSTVNREMSIIRHLLSLAVRWGYIEKNPLQGLGSLKENNSDRWTYLTKEEFGRLQKAINPIYRDLLVFLTYTGLRLGDALRLLWGDVNLETGVLLVRAMRTKGRHGYGIPLHPEALKILQHRAKTWNGSGPVREERIFRHSDSEFRRAFKQALKKAGLPTSIRIHDLRHTFASWLAMAGVPILEIQALLGHKSVNMTMRYAHLNPSVLRGAVEKI